MHCRFALLHLSAAIVLTFAVSGCLQSDLVPVTGTLLVGGEPAPGVNIFFLPLDPANPVCPKARTEKDGTFRLVSNAVQEGARPGNYVVTLFWWDPLNPYDDCSGAEVLKHDILRGRYHDSRKSPLRATVNSGHNHIVIKAEAPPPRAEQKSTQEKLSSTAGPAPLNE